MNTNRIIAALIRDSSSRKLLYHADMEFLGIRFSELEIGRHTAFILDKAKISEAELDAILAKITARIVFLDDELIRLHMEEAGKIMSHIDPDDTPFIAAALATGADIWSDDAHFMKQKRIKVWKTADLAGLLENSASEPP
ncbi:PIN domain-containing protein [Candidatus Micrarchaeota archaeon]|nr:PIN domain-containing protein [Candidatus Micrarchaeota archaeon]